MASPVPGYKITTPYGVSGAWSAGYHTGNDYAAPSGTTVVAMRAGTVTKAVWDGDYGNRVEVLTDGIEHSYSHLSAMSVWVGQYVEEGQQIGKVGSTGNSTGPHCHVEERHSPYGYSDDREPQFHLSAGQPPQEEDMTPEQAEDLRECRRMLAVLLSAQEPVHEVGEQSIPEQLGGMMNGNSLLYILLCVLAVLAIAWFAVAVF